MAHNIDFEELSAFMDGELGREDAARVEAHLGSCGECASYLSRIKSASSRFKAHGADEVPAGLLKRSLSEAGTPRKKPSPPPHKLLGIRKWALVAATLLVLFLLSGMTLKRFMPDLFEQVQGMISAAAGNLGK